MPKMQVKKKPKTQAEWAAYRCQESCKTGREVITNGRTTASTSPLEYAAYMIFHAIEDLSKQIEEKRK